MFNVGAGEVMLILVAALLVLGPQRLPELARGLGKFLREFRRQTDEIRTVVEREFYRMDQDVLDQRPAPKATLQSLPPASSDEKEKVPSLLPPALAPPPNPGAPEPSLIPGEAPAGTKPRGAMAPPVSDAPPAAPEAAPVDHASQSDKP